MSYYYDCCNGREKDKEEINGCKHEKQFCCKKLVEESICCYPQPWHKEEKENKHDDCKEHDCGCFQMNQDCNCYKNHKEYKCNKKDDHRKEDCYEERKEDDCKQNDNHYGDKKQRCNCCICNFFRCFR